MTNDETDPDYVRRYNALSELMRIGHELGSYADCDECELTGGHVVEMRYLPEPERKDMKEIDTG